MDEKQKKFLEELQDLLIKYNINVVSPNILKGLQTSRYDFGATVDTCKLTASEKECLMDAVHTTANTIKRKEGTANNGRK